MGMTASYKQITVAELAALRIVPDPMANVWKLLDDAVRPSCYIDKMWDATHFLLTGRTLDHRGDDALSDAILGAGTLGGDTEGVHVGVSTTQQVKRIAEAWDHVDVGALLARFTMHEFAAHGIYPPIWDRYEEMADIKDDLADACGQLARFYRSAAALNHAALVIIG